MAKSNFTIWVNEDVYWCLDLTPIQNECDEFINRCALIDSKTQQEIEAINFDSEWLVPIFQTRSQIGIKEFGMKLKEITDKRGIVITDRKQMPQDKRIKETKHVGKVRKI
jgi:hypothetical protein